MSQKVTLIHPETEAKIAGTFTDEEYALLIAEGYVQAPA